MKERCQEQLQSQNRDDTFRWNEHFPEYEVVSTEGVPEYPVTGEFRSFGIQLLPRDIKGQILYGEKGVGKTVFFKQFIRQGMKEVFGQESSNFRVVQVYDRFVESCKEERQMVEKFYQLCQKFEGKNILLYYNAKGAEMVNRILQFFERYADAICKQANLGMFKLVLEYTLQNYQDETIKKINSDAFGKYKLRVNPKFKERMKIFEQMSKDLSQKYNINICRKDLMMIIILADGVFETSSNYRLYYEVLEILFAYANNRGNKKISRVMIVDILFGEEFKKQSKEELLKIAYHESGHTLLCLLHREICDLNFITIIPGRNHSGVTDMYTTDNPPVKERSVYISLIARKLAGREAEKLCPIKVNANIGASSDLSGANELARDMVLKLGASKCLGRNVIVQSNEYSNLTEIAKRNIELEMARIIDEATNEAWQAVYKHRAFIEELSNKLLKEYYVSGDQVRAMWEKHLNQIKKEEK